MLHTLYNNLILEKKIKTKLKKKKILLSWYTFQITIIKILKIIKNIVNVKPLCENIV